MRGETEVEEKRQEGERREGTGRSHEEREVKQFGEITESRQEEEIVNTRVIEGPEI